MSCKRCRVTLVGSFGASCSHEASFTCSTRFQSFTFRRSSWAIEIVLTENSSRYLSLSLFVMARLVFFGWSYDDTSTMTTVGDVDNVVGNLNCNLFAAAVFLGSSGRYEKQKFASKVSVYLVVAMLYTVQCTQCHLMQMY